MKLFESNQHLFGMPSGIKRVPFWESIEVFWFSTRASVRWRLELGKLWLDLSLDPLIAIDGHELQFM